MLPQTVTLNKYQKKGRSEGITKAGVLLLCGMTKKDEEDRKKKVGAPSPALFSL
jgi:hypothetical protein